MIDPAYMQTRLETDSIVRQIADKVTVTNDLCKACMGTGLAPVILGMQDACVLCFGTGKRIIMPYGVNKEQE